MTAESDTRRKYIDKMYSKLDETVVEAFEAGNDIGLIKASKMATYLNVNERTLRRNGFPDHFDEKQPGCTWEQYKGLKVDLEKYIRDRELVSKIDTRDISEDPDGENDE